MVWLQCRFVFVVLGLFYAWSRGGQSERSIASLVSLKEFDFTRKDSMFDFTRKDSTAG